MIITSRTIAPPRPHYCFCPSLPPSLPPFQSLDTIFDILEKKLSLLLSAWKPLWRAHCNAKGLRARLIAGVDVKLAGGGTDGGRRDTVTITSGVAAAKHGLRRREMDSRLATKRKRAGGGGGGGGGGKTSLADLVLEMMRSVASAGVDIEVFHFLLRAGSS